MTFAEAVGIAANTVSRYETGSLDIPKWVELALQALEHKHIQEIQKQSSA